MAAPMQLSLLLLLAVASVHGRPGPQGGGRGGVGPGMSGPQDGSMGPGPFYDDKDWPGRLDNPLNCTTAMDLLQGDEAEFATFLTLVDSLNMTEVLEWPVPPFVEEIRAPTEAFFTAWYAASGTTALPDVSTLNATQIRDLQHAVMGLLAPKDMLLCNDTFGPGGRGMGPGSPWDMDGNNMPCDGPDGDMPMGPGQPLQGPGPNGPQFGAEASKGNGPQGGGGTQGDQAPPPKPNGPQGPQRRLFGQGPGNRGGKGPQGGDQAGSGPPQGQGMPDGKGWAAPEFKCANVTLVAVEEVLEGAGACPLAACLPCSGVEGCSCVDCKCACSA